MGGRNKAAVAISENLGIRYAHALRLLRTVVKEGMTFPEMLEAAKQKMESEREG